jgi:hypothetical protein
VTEFDSLGFAAFSATLGSGNYELIVYDIMGTDTLSVRLPFELTAE